MRSSKAIGSILAGSGPDRYEIRNGGGLMSPAEVQEILEWERLEEQADFTEVVGPVQRSPDNG